MKRFGLRFLSLGQIIDESKNNDLVKTSLTQNLHFKFVFEIKNN